MERKAVTASIFRRDRSLVYPSRDPSLLAVLHSSGTRSFSRLMIVRSVLSTLTYRNQSPSAVGAISLILLRYSWSVETKSAYIGSLVRLWSTGGRRGRHPRNVRKAASRYTTKTTGDNESLCQRVPTVELNWADRASSTLAVIFVSDSRSRMIRMLSVSRNEFKTSRSFFRRIVSNARDKLIPSMICISCACNIFVVIIML